MARIDAWTMEQDDLLAAEWGMWPDREIARWLGRSVGACYQRAQILGVRKRDNLARAAAEGREPVVEQRREPADVRGWRKREAA